MSKVEKPKEETSKPEAHFKLLYCPALLGCSFVFVLAIALTCHVPLGSGVVSGMGFWGNLIPQLMALTQSVNIPDYDNQYSSSNVTPAALSPLPRILNPEDKGWKQTLMDRIEYEPVVVRGLMKAEKQRFGNMTTLQFDDLLDVYGDYNVSVFTHMTRDKSAVKMPYSEYHKKMVAGEPLYARAVPDLGFITDNVDLGWLADLIGKGWALWLTLQTASGGSTGGRLPLTFIGSDKVFSQAHSDVGTSIFMMIQGRKRWMFFPPTETPYMYPYGQQGNVAFNAGLDVFNPDSLKYPEFLNAQGYEVVIEPGDVMFFPSMWWHAIQNLDPITIGTDVPMIDMLGSWRRNSIFTMCTLLNPNLIVNYAIAAWNGLSMREMYFKGYLVDEEQK